MRLWGYEVFNIRGCSSFPIDLRLEDSGNVRVGFSRTYVGGRAGQGWG